MSSLPILVIIIPLGFAFLSSFAALLAPRASRPLALLGAVTHTGAVFALVARVAATGPVVYEIGGWPPPIGIVLAVDELSALFLIIVAVGCLLTFFFSQATRPAGAEKLNVLFFLAAASLSGWVTTGDLFNLFVFVELTTVVTIGIVAFKSRADSAASGFVYMVFASLSGTLFLLAVALLYGATGTLNMAHIAARLHLVPPRTLTVALTCVIVSFGIKIGLVPLHFWQPGAYAAAGSTAAGLLSGVVMKASIYGLARVVWTVLDGGGPHGAAVSGVLLAAGCVNILVGHTLALCQDDLKKLLAFSSVAHVGYVLLGMGTGSAAGLVAALLHAFNHFLMKVSLFWSGRAFIEHERSPLVTRMNGIVFETPTAFVLFFIAAISIVGVPPTNGFASKWLIALAALDHQFIIPVVVIAVGTVISLWYYARLFAHGMRLRPTMRSPAPRRPLASLTVAVPVTACLIGGFAAGPVLPFLERAVMRLTEPASYIAILFPGGL